MFHIKKIESIIPKQLQTLRVMRNDPNVFIYGQKCVKKGSKLYVIGGNRFSRNSEFNSPLNWMIVDLQTRVCSSWQIESDFDINEWTFNAHGLVCVDDKIWIIGGAVRFKFKFLL